MKTEIVSTPDLTIEQLCLLQMHSFLNIFNVLIGEFDFLSMTSGDETITGSALRKLTAVAHGLDKQTDTLSYLIQLGDLEHHVNHAVALLLERHPHLRSDPEVQDSLDNIMSVFNILHVRVGELVERRDNLDRWGHFSIDRLQSELHRVCAAIAKNSKGRYGIVHNIACQQADDYLVQCQITSPDGATIFMPLVFQDVMRDLLANARKYTDPGGQIIMGLHHEGADLRFVVQDNGHGIPPDEMALVTDFGYRGSNVQEKRTMGAGIGLTKAVVVTKRLNGQFWIESTLGRGTRITIHIPCPQPTEDPAAIPSQMVAVVG